MWYLNNKTTNSRLAFSATTTRTNYAPTSFDQQVQVSQGYSLRTAHHKLLLLRIIGFRRKDRIGYKPLSYREVLERTGSERIETTTRKRQLGFAGALVRQGDSRLSKRVMFGWLAVQGPKRGDRPATSWVDRLQKNLEAFGAVPRKERQRTEVGRIRSCCQGWTGLDDCCEEHGPVAPGGREGSGSTR